MQLARQLHRAVERDPAHEFGVEEMLRLPADLPYPVVFLAPLPGGAICKIGKEVADPRGEASKLAAQAKGSIEDLTVHIELRLVPGAVSHPDGPAATPSVQLGKDAFGQVVFPSYTEHDLKGMVRTSVGGRRGHESKKLLGFVGAGGDPEGFHGETRVPDPCVSVV